VKRLYILALAACAVAVVLVLVALEHIGPTISESSDGDAIRATGTPEEHDSAEDMKPQFDSCSDMNRGSGGPGPRDFT